MNIQEKYNSESNSKYSFFFTDCHKKINEFNLPYYLPLPESE